MLFSPALLAHARQLLADCEARKLKIVTAESCTGGLVAGLLTEIAGSSAVVERGLVAYSNEAKQDLLGVPAALIAENGAVSEPVARAMADGALKRARADLSIAITGVAGPGGGTPAKPVGLVHFAAARNGWSTVHERHLFGDIGRTEIRLASVQVALTLLGKFV